MIPSEVMDIAQLGALPLFFWVLQKLAAIKARLDSLPCSIGPRGPERCFDPDTGELFKSPTWWEMKHMTPNEVVKMRERIKLVLKERHEEQEAGNTDGEIIQGEAG